MNPTFNFTKSEKGNKYSLVFPISKKKVTVNYSKVTIEDSQDTNDNISTIKVNTLSVKPITKSFDKESAKIQEVTTITKDGKETILEFNDKQILKRKISDGIESIYFHKDSNKYTNMILNDLQQSISEDNIASIITYIDENGNKFYSENFMNEEIYLGV